jgi:hypothetical protein
MSLPPVNYLAVLVAGIVIFVLGGLWYSKVLFANRWIALMGINEEQMKADAARSSMPLMMLQAFLTGLIIAWGMGVVLRHFHNLSAARGAMVGALCWLAFAAPTSYATNLFSMRPKALWAINSFYNLVSFVLAGVILAVWR